MELVLSSMIPKIDKFAEEVLKIPTVTLMGRSGDAVACAARELAPDGARVIILAGKGNNGGDGYAAAASLSDSYSVIVYDVFSSGQRSEAGKYWYAAAKRSGADIRHMTDVSLAEEDILSADLVIDAIFGTGFSGEVPDNVIRLSRAANRSLAKRIAVDVPIGVDADRGTVSDFAFRADVTVELSYPKAGIVSQPARELAGKIITDSLGIDSDAVRAEFHFNRFLTDEAEAKKLLPTRPENSSKGSFGRVLLIVGSDKYRGAAHLALEAALRGGAGYVTYVGSEGLCTELRMKLPEAIYRPENLSDSLSVSNICTLSAAQSVTLIGSGCDCTEQLFALTAALISTEGTPLILDADAVNAIAKFGSADILKSAKRPIVLTPHPLEFSRLSGIEVDRVNANRLEIAEAFAREYGCVLLLKGSATIVTDGIRTYVNGSGSSALAKAGSGDVLAGLAASLCAQYADFPHAAPSKPSPDDRGKVACKASRMRVSSTPTVEITEITESLTDLVVPSKPSPDDRGKVACEASRMRVSAIPTVEIIEITESLTDLVALAAYIHGRAGDDLSATLSVYGVTPSDLPRECARVMAQLSK